MLFENFHAYSRQKHLLENPALFKISWVRFPSGLSQSVYTFTGNSAATYYNYPVYCSFFQNMLELRPVTVVQ